MRRYRGAAPLCYWKPIQTGIEQDDDTATVRRLGNCADDEIFDHGVRLPRPVSPHLAARLSGQEIELTPLTALVAGQSKNVRWIVEGAGGVLVPVSDTDKMTDLMRELNLPVVVVARSTLGTINHTLLTLEALRSRSLCVAGVVMVGESNPDNRSSPADCWRLHSRCSR
jgi:dethiobiotin synthase